MTNAPYRHREPLVLTIFGATGDLAKLKIFPSVFELAEQKRLPEGFWLIGYGRSARTNETFREAFAKSIKAKYAGTWGAHQDEVLAALLPRVSYFQGQYDQVADHAALVEYRNELTGDTHTRELYYYSVPPHVFGPITEALATALGDRKDRARLIIEKPFGSNEATARELFHTIGERFSDDQLYLLDHYLGKRAVRSILPLRHHNRLLNLMLKGAAVSAIYVNALEPFGVEERLGYFDQVGTLRDMVQSHLLQILALCTMSIPVTLKPEAIRKEKAAILSALHFEPNDQSVALGQYAGYCDDGTCNPFTPTFAALKVMIDRESWFGVPIYLRSGKHVGTEKETYVTVELKKFAFQDRSFPSNRITLELSPEERLGLTLFDGDGDLTGIGKNVSGHSISCSGDDCLSEHGLLLLDVLKGDQTHFLSFEEIIAAWRVLDRVINYTKEQKPEVYSKGTDGPSRQFGLTNAWYPRA